MNNNVFGSRAIAHLRILLAICAVVLLPCSGIRAMAWDSGVYRNKVIFTAPSAEKIFDGTPLTEQIDVTAQGLPDGFTYKAVAEGSVTYPEDNEENNNIVTDYVIYDPSGLNVTDKFVNVELRPGTLRISEKEAVLGAKRDEETSDSDAGGESRIKTDNADEGDTVDIEDEETAKSDKMNNRGDYSLELVLYSFLIIIMLAVFVIFMMDSNKMREK
ncbi:hypothetical protein [Butyrivibrio sp. AE3004]|uniref:hypothetical protein n=1 Tax=Butyrivibrio sp. AE3004 TaxID=1506994 RepID=UPI0004948344|nr:hypothetical protein [Butyrivibrio sp. AE3004]